MIQIDIIKGKDYVIINRISKDGEFLEVYNEKENKINLSVLKDYVGQEASFVYYTEDKHGQIKLKEIKTRTISKFGYDEYGNSYIAF